jgi:hypothetical protein
MFNKHTGLLNMPKAAANRTEERAIAEGDSRHARVRAVMGAAERSGLLKEKSGRIAGRVSATLVAQAKKRTGIQADSELIAFALANVALEDNFAEAFRKMRGKVDPDLKLGF